MKKLILLTLKQNPKNVLKLKLICPLENAFESVNIKSQHFNSPTLNTSPKSQNNNFSSQMTKLKSFYDEDDYVRSMIVRVDQSKDSCEVSLTSHVENGKKMVCKNEKNYCFL